MTRKSKVATNKVATNKVATNKVTATGAPIPSRSSPAKFVVPARRPQATESGTSLDVVQVLQKRNKELRWALEDVVAMVKRIGGYMTPEDMKVMDHAEWVLNDE